MAKQSIQFVGRYCLTLFCDTVHPEKENQTVSQEFFGRTHSQCVSQARRARWKVNDERKTATCPYHARVHEAAAKTFAQRRRNGR